MEFYNMTSEQADEAIAKYRERFSEKGMFENEVYGGIYDLLRSLQGNGMHLAVASSKPTVYGRYQSGESPGDPGGASPIFQGW